MFSSRAIRKWTSKATAPFFAQLRRAGWIEGQNISHERLLAHGQHQDHSSGLRHGNSDPTVVGLVASLARPGANATGTFHIQADSVAKKFEMVREAMPRVRRIGALLDTKASGDYPQQKQRHHDAGRQFGFDVSMADFSRFDELAALIAKFKNEQIDVVTVSSSFTLISRRKDFVELTRQARIASLGTDWSGPKRELC